jgi:hypothetical protein
MADASVSAIFLWADNSAGFVKSGYGLVGPIDLQGV